MTGKPAGPPSKLLPLTTSNKLPSIAVHSIIPTRPSFLSPRPMPPRLAGDMSYINLTSSITSSNLSCMVVPNSPMLLLAGSPSNKNATACMAVQKQQSRTCSLDLFSSLNCPHDCPHPHLPTVLHYAVATCFWSPISRW